MQAQPISVLYPVWNNHVHFCSHTPQSRQKQMGGSHTIHIIIADNPDMHLFPDLLCKNLHQPVHIFHLMRI